MQTSVKETLPRATAPGTRRAGSSPLWSYVVAAGLAIFYFVTSYEIAAHRVFWFDELFTLHIARLPQLGTIWTALSNGVDALPPTYYVTVRLFDSLFGPGDVAARIPSMIAMAIGLLLIFDCARRLTDGLHGLIALSVATCSFLPYYGYEARSYAIYFMLAALALWAWTNDSLSRTWQAVLFGAAFFAGECFHYYFGMCLLPFVLWEFLHWKKGQRPSLKILAGIVGCVVPVLLFSSLILSFSGKFAGGYWNRPSFLELRAIYSQLFPDGLFLLALIAIWIVLSRSDEQKNEVLEPMQPAEATGWLFLAIPLAAFVVAVWKTNAFYSRYFIGVLPGVAVAFAYMLWRHFRRVTQISMGVFLLLAMWGIRPATDDRAPSRQGGSDRHPAVSGSRKLAARGRQELLRFLRAAALPGSAAIFRASRASGPAVARRLQPPGRGRARSVPAPAARSQFVAVLPHAGMDGGRSGAAPLPVGTDPTWRDGAARFAPGGHSGDHALLTPVQVDYLQ